MLCTLEIRLAPNKEQFNSLLGIMKQFNKACNYISQRAFETKTFTWSGLRKLTYHSAKEKFALLANLLVRATGKVSQAYSNDKTKQQKFHETDNIIFDNRTIAVKDAEYVSVPTLDGNRILVKIVFKKYHYPLVFSSRKHKQADLIYKNNEFHLFLVVDLPEEAIKNLGT